MGNVAITNAFKQFSFFLSKLTFPWVLSVLLVLSSCFVKKNCRSFNAQRCLCFSAFKITFTSFTLLGVTQVQMISSPTGILHKSFCLRDPGRLGNRGQLNWLKSGTLSLYGDLCNVPKFRLHCSYLGWVLDINLFGVPQCFFITHFGHFSILLLQCQGYFKPNINSLFISSILKGSIAKRMAERNISLVCEIIVKFML